MRNENVMLIWNSGVRPLLVPGSSLEHTFAWEQNVKIRGKKCCKSVILSGLRQSRAEMCTFFFFINLSLDIFCQLTLLRVRFHYLEPQLCACAACGVPPPCVSGIICMPRLRLDWSRWSVAVWRSPCFICKLIEARHICIAFHFHQLDSSDDKERSTHCTNLG